MAEATTGSSSNPEKPRSEGTSQRKSSKFQFIAPLKPEKGESRGSALEWIDTVLGWFAFTALLLPVFASATLYLWADENDNTYPVPGTVSMVKDAVSRDETAAQTTAVNNAAVASLDTNNLTYYLKIFSFGCSTIVVASGYYFAYKLCKARHVKGYLDPVTAIKSKARCVPAVVAFIGLAPWLFVVANVSDAGFKQGNLLYIIDAGLVCSVFWFAIRFWRMRVKAAKGDAEKGSAH